MFDAETIEISAPVNADALKPEPITASSPSAAYEFTKRVMDLAAVVMLAPFALVAAAVLVFLNPLFNRGPLLFRQTRMGQNCVPFTAYKFRSMQDVPEIERGAFDALEEHRITRLGCMMRKLRIDELPQIINIFKGDMSLVGPRPDYIEHAHIYVSEIPGYKNRYDVRPGVTGLAQTEVGYVSDEVGFRRKVAADLTYIRKMSIAYDLKVILRTVQIVVARHGR